MIALWFQYGLFAIALIASAAKASEIWWSE